jgi:hypothetical protein
MLLFRYVISTTFRGNSFSGGAAVGVSDNTDLTVVEDNVYAQLPRPLFAIPHTHPNLNAREPTLVC